MYPNKESALERRNNILLYLKQSKEPLTGHILAEKSNVSRQVIVQDIAILKARQEPIIATSQGYVYISNENSNNKFRKLIACKHSSKETIDELNTIVDFGVHVLDVSVEHPVYGEITAPLLIKNRRDVSLFINKIEEANAHLLSSLTDGIHIHTLEAETKEQLSEVCQALSASDYLISKNEN